MPKIERLPSGAYSVRISMGKGPDGKYHSKRFTADDKPTLRRLIARYEDGPEEEAPMLLDAISDYIDAKTAVLSPYTIRGYENIAARLRQLSCVHVRCDAGAPAFQMIVNELIGAGKSSKTIRNTIGLISSAVKWAGYAMPAVTLPQKDHTELFIPDEDAMRRVMGAVAGTDLEIPVALGMMGLRRGEVCGLRVGDIKGTTAHICRAAVDIGGVVTMKQPKTYDSDRYVQLPAQVVKKIRKQGYVTKMTPENISYRFAATIKKAGIAHFRFHDLRHFFVSYCHNVLRLSDAQIQKLGGWKTDRIMKQHYLQSMQDEAARQTAADGLSVFVAESWQNVAEKGGSDMI